MEEEEEKKQRGVSTSCKQKFIDGPREENYDIMKLSL
jgi:hypothetical protein